MTTTLTLQDRVTLELGPHCEVIHYTDHLTDEQFSGLREKVWGIGGSAAAASMGLSPYQSPYHLWAEMTGTIPREKATVRMKRGQQMEPLIAEMVRDELGIAEMWAPKVILRSKKYPWMIASPDRFCLGENGEVAGVELKNTSLRLESLWADDGVPPHVELQCHHYLAVTGLKRWLIGGLVDGWDLRTRWIERDDDLIEDMVKSEQRFWQHVDNGVEPPIDGAGSTTTALKARYPSDDGETLEFLDGSDEATELRALCRERQRHTKLISDAKKSVKEAENRLIALMGDKSVARINDRTVCTYRSQTRKAYEVPEKSYRVLRTPEDPTDIEEEPF